MNLKGEKRNFRVFLETPGGKTSNVDVTDGQMADGEESIWISISHSPSPGTYYLWIEDLEGNKLYERNLGPYSGPRT